MEEGHPESAGQNPHKIEGETSCGKRSQVLYRERISDPLRPRAMPRLPAMGWGSVSRGCIGAVLSSEITLWECRPCGLMGKATGTGAIMRVLV